MDEIEIPSHFLCPISLQLMRDPVTISTGITYDRDSIEKWLFSCKKNKINTCPVTRQALQNSDRTPNHTLGRLIQAWSSHGIQRIPTPELLKDAENNSPAQTQLKCLETLSSIALQSQRNRTCLQSTGAVQFLVSIINKNYNDSNLLLKTEASGEALSILYHMNISESCLKSIMISNHQEFVQSLVRVMKNSNYQSRAYAVTILKRIFEQEDPTRLTSATPEFFAEIVRTLRDQISQQASKAALKILVELCPWGRNRIKAVEGGAVFVLIELLLLLETTSDNKRVSELCLVVLDQLCGCAEGRAEFLSHGAGVAVVAKKIFRVSHVASERAVRILSSVCRFSATVRVIQEMFVVGVVAKLCLVLQLDSSYKTKEKAREILKLHARVWRNSPCIPSHLLNSYPSS